MFRFFDSGLCPIGIDVGAHAVRMVQFRAGAEGLSLQAACRIEIDSLGAAASGVLGGARAAVAVQHGLANRDFLGKRVVLCLPAGSVHAKSVRLPQMPDSDLNQALQWEAKDRFGFEVGETMPGGGGGGGGQLVWFRVGEVRRGTEVKDELLLFAVEGSVINDYVQALAAMNLQVAAVDLAPCAMHRSVSRTPAAGQALAGGGAGAVLDIGHAGSQFFVTSGGELVFYKYVDMGARTVHEAVAAKLGITVGEAVQMRARLMGGGASDEAPGADDAAPLGQALRDAMRAPLEELARELDMCMRYYVVTFRGARPETVLITGRQASCMHTRDILAAALGLAVEEAQPLRGVANLGDAARPDRSGEWAVAAGLSLYPVGARVRALAEAAA